MPKALYANDPSSTTGLGIAFIDATAAEIDRAVDASARVVVTTATTLSLTLTQHAGKVVCVETNSASGFTGTLPAASGSGNTYRIRNNIAQTQGTITFTAAGTDLFVGKALAFDTTAAADAGAFLSTATSKKVAMNRTTTGGLGYDELVATDKASGVWMVDFTFVGSGTLATPFSA